MTEPETPVPAPHRRRIWPWVLGLALVGPAITCLLVAAGPLLVYRYRAANAKLDATLEVEVVEADDAAVEATRSAIATRLRRRRILARVEATGPTRLRISHPAAEAPTVHALVLSRVELRFLKLVDHLSPLETQLEIARVLEAQARGPLPDSERYDVAMWARAGAAGAVPALLERPGVGGPDAIADLRRTFDDRGKLALGFELTPAASKEFRKLTRRSIGSRLAIVVNDEIRSAPEVLDEIGGTGVVSGGPAGWDEAELERLILLLDDPLPRAVQLATPN